MGFVCEWEVFEIIEKTFLQGDTSLPARARLAWPCQVSCSAPGTGTTTRYMRWFCVHTWKF